MLSHKTKHIIVAFILLICNSNLEAQISISDTNKKYLLHFQVLESSRSVGKYISGSTDSLGYVSYNYKQLSHKTLDNDRMFTLRAKFFLNQSLEEHDFSLIFPPVFYPCNIYLNGKLIGKRGNTGQAYTSRLHYTENYFLPPGLLQFGNEKYNEIAIELLPEYGEHHSFSKVYLAEKQTADTYSFWRNTVSITFLRALIFASFTIFLYFIILYFSRKKSRFSYYLPFAFACLFYSVSYFNNLYNFNFSQTVNAEKVTRIGMNLWSYFSLFYILEYSKIIKRRKLLLLITCIPILIFSIIIGFLENAKQVTDFFNTYNYPYLFLMTTAVIFTAIWFYIKSRTKQAFLLGIVYVFCIFGGLYDSYFSILLQAKPFLMFLPYNMFLTILVFFFIVAWEQAAIYKFATQKSKDLEQLNENLEKIIKQRTTQVKNNEERFKFVLEGSQLGFWDWDLRTNTIIRNKRWAEMLGYTLEEIENTQKLWIEYIHPEDRESVQKSIDDHLQSRSLQHRMEYRMLKKAGDFIWVLDQAQIVSRDSSDKPLRMSGTHTDITERKQAEQALNESRSHIKAISDNLPNGILYQMYSKSKTEHVFSYISGQVTKLYGFTPEEVINNSEIMYQALHKDDLPRLIEEQKYCVANLSIFEIEVRYRNKDGEYHWCRLIAKPETTNDKVIWYGIQIDIDKQKRTEQALKNNQELLNQTGKLARVGGWELDLGKKQLFWTQATKMIHEVLPDYKPNLQEAIDFYVGDSKELIKKAVNSAIEKGKSFDLELKLRTAKGTILFTRSIGLPIMEEGKCVRIYGMFQDITQKKKIEHLQKENIEKFQFLSNTASELIRLKTPDQILDYTGNCLLNLIPDSLIVIQLFDHNKKNITFHQLYGTNEKQYDEIVSIVDNQSTREKNIILNHSLQKMYETGKVKAFPLDENKSIDNIFSNQTITRLKKNSAIKKMYGIGLLAEKELYACIQILTGNHTGISSPEFIETFIYQASTALNERLIQEIIVMAKNEAERANKIKTEFIANMSHEIRTPLNVILGFSEILKSRISDKQYHTYIEGIHSSGSNLLSLINDILDLSKIEAGHLEIKPDPINVLTVLNEVKQMLNTKALNKNLLYTIEIPDNFPEFILLDEVRIRQILFNIIGNAIKFTEKGFVKISVGIHTMTEKELSFSIQVKDSGIGISSKNLELIFEPFRQQEEHISKKFGGTGLGLSITKRLTQAMNGKITVESELKRGSTFTITFNKVPITSLGRLEIQSIENIDFKGQSVLIVDDMASNLDILKDYLINYNLKIYTAQNGQEALKIIKKIQPDVLIVDVIMPSISGIDIAKQLKNNEKFKSTCIIGQSISTKENSVYFDHYLIKPILKKHLLRVMVKYLDHKIVNKASTEDEIKDAEAKVMKKLMQNESIRNDLIAIVPLVEETKNYISMPEIEKVADHLMQTGQKHNAEPLINYAKKIYIAIQNFDVIQINELFKKFPPIPDSA